MATAGESKSSVSPSPPKARRDGLFRWTAAQAHELSRLGYFADRHVELLDGVLFEMTIDPPLAVATALAQQILQGYFGPGYCVRSQAPLDLGRRSAPEPDIAVVAGSHRDYSDRHPKAAVLVVEVSDSTLRKDRVLKGHLYARAGIADYWIINLVDGWLEVHRDPAADPSRTGRYRYGSVMIVPADGHVTPLVAAGAGIAVAEMLP